MLSVSELYELEEEIKEHLTEALTLLNRTDRLDELLSLLGMDDNSGNEPDFERYVKTGRIVIVGDAQTNKDQLVGVAKGMGIEKDRLEFCLDYKEAKKFDFNKMQWNPKYLLIMVGPMPHSSISKGNYGSAISKIENTEGYPPVIHLGNNDLKITKSDFRNKLKEAMQNGFIA